MSVVDLAPLLETAPKPGAHTYGRKLRRAIVPMGAIEALLSLNGERSYRMAGWPEGGKIVGADILRSPFALVVYIYHPDFPVVPVNEMPSLIKVEAHAVA